MIQNTISVSELRDLLEQGKPVTVLDIRRSAERAEWSIPGSLHVDAYDAIWEGDPTALDGFNPPDDAPVVAVCVMGRTSLLAAAHLRQRGLQAMSLEGGMQAWSLAWNWAKVPVPGSNAKIIQVRRTGKGCLSYIAASDGAAAVIDPSLEPQVYLDLATRNRWHIKAVLDTHVHADHLSRARMLAARTGASLYLPDQNRVSYKFDALHDGDAVAIGGAEVKALHTPGHTDESVCYLLDDRALFTGDTLFLDSVGRPDLMAVGGETRARAQKLYRSLQDIMGLLDETIILPTHTSVPIPFDGKPLCSPLAQVRRHATLLGRSENEFVESILGRIPPTPPNHRQIVELNEAGVFPEEYLINLEAGANRCAIV